jgi:hydroxymethylbilane synthase
MTVAEPSTAHGDGPAPGPGDRVIRIGTRASALALVQAGMVADALARVGVRARLTTIVTEGDRRSPDTPWGEGAFVGAIEQALLDGSVDLAVHSAKDVPTDEHPGLCIAAYMQRADARDVLVLPAGVQGSLETMAPGSRIGTDSPRRTAFLRVFRPDLLVHPLHGNVDTRLRRLDAGETDALVLAAAGLVRLGRNDRISAVLPTALVPSAPGQGALAIQVRADDATTTSVAARLDDPSTRRAVMVERALLAASGGGCRAPLGALATTVGDSLTLHAGFATIDGSISARATATSDGPTSDGPVIAAVLRRLADDAADAALARGRTRVLVARADEDAIPLSLALVDRGLAPVAVPCIAVEDLPGAPSGPGLARALRDVDWVVLTSRHGARRVAHFLRDRPGPRVAVVGPSVARVVRAAGVEVAIEPSVPMAAALAEAIPVTARSRVAVVRGDLAGDALAERLQARGATVRTLVVYRTVEAPATSRTRLVEALRRPVAAIVLTSGSTVRGWLTLAAATGMTSAAHAVPCIAIGPSTAAACRSAGLVVLAEAPAPDPATVAATVASALIPGQE